jgi:hypothetical protein
MSSIPNKSDKYPIQHVYGHKRPFMKRVLHKLARIIGKKEINEQAREV